MSRPTVLAVDDVIENVELLAAFLESVDCEVVTSTSGSEALARVAGSRVDLVLLDVDMPGLNGLEVCRSIKQSAATRMVPVVMVTAYDALNDRVAALEAGADDFLSKPVEQAELIARVKSLLRIKSTYDSLLQTEQVIFALAETVEAKNPFTEQHSKRVASYARRLAIAAGLDEEAVSLTYFAAMVHDIGKIGIPDSILNKRDGLAPEEAAVLRQVPVIGSEICAPLRSAAGLQEVIRHQKEKFDGSGYPDGLRGDQISVAARILAICDGYDSMVSGEREARPHMAEEKAKAVLRRLSTRSYDDELVRTFLDVVLAGPTKVPADATQGLEVTAR